MRQNWTKAEESDLIRLLSCGHDNKQIAKALKRSVSSVQHKRARLFRDAEQTDKLSAVTYCDDPHRPGEIVTEDELMQEVSDVIERLNTLSEALAGTSEFMEQLAEGQKIITEDHIEEARNVKALRIDLDTACGEIGRLNDKLNSLTTKLTVITDAHDKTARKLEEALRDVHDLSTYMAQGRLWRLFHSFRSFKRGARK